MKTILSLSIFLLLSSCASYQSTVSSRSVAGYAKDDRIGAAYTVTYR